MNEYFRHLGLFRSLQQSLEVVNVRMNSTITNKTEVMETTVSRFGPVESVTKSLLVLQSVVLHSHVDAHQVLELHTTGTNR